MSDRRITWWVALLLASCGLADEAVRVQHGLVFDAGSSGTRVHVYTWKSGGANGNFNLVSDDLLKIKPGARRLSCGPAPRPRSLRSPATTRPRAPCATLRAGLSAFKDSPGAAGDSLSPLLTYAYDRIAEDKRTSAPAYLMATAGLRLVGEDKKDEIIRSVCDKLGGTPFTFKCAWATLLSGYDEGLYGWVTVNYLMKALQSAEQTTYGTIDLGGGSVQIVFEPRAGAALPEPYLASVPLPGGEKRVYVKSHLGYGLDEARRSVAAVIGNAGKRVHPCLPAGKRASRALARAPATPASGPRVTRSAGAARASRCFLRAGYRGEVTTTGGGSVEMKGGGNYAACVKLVESIFPRAECPLAPCSIQGAYQPALSGEWVGFSYMYDRTKQIGLLDDDPQVYGEQKMDIPRIKQAAQRLCALDADVIRAKYAAHPEPDKAHNFCGDVVFIAALLERGFGFSPSTVFRMTNKIDSVEIVWTLGAMIAKANERMSGSGGPSSLLAISAVALVVLLVLVRFRKSLFAGYGLLPFR